MKSTVFIIVYLVLLIASIVVFLMNGTSESLNLASENSIRIIAAIGVIYTFVQVSKKYNFKA